MSHEPLVVMVRNPISRSHLAIKRGIDIVGSSLALTLLAPIMVLVAAAIWFEDHGPVTYTSKRVGQRGRTQESCLGEGRRSPDSLCLGLMSSCPCRGVPC